MELSKPLKNVKNHTEAGRKYDILPKSDKMRIHGLSGFKRQSLNANICNKSENIKIWKNASKEDECNLSKLFEIFFVSSLWQWGPLISMIACSKNQNVKECMKSMVSI